MQAWQVHNWCEPEQMTLASMAAPDPGPGEVRIRVHAAAVNFFDLLQVQGKYQVKPPFPFTPGAEVAGVVEAAGPGAAYAPGAEVVALPLGGGFATHVTTGRFVLPVPPGLDFAQAAALPIVYGTSLFALEHRGRLQPGECLLVHAGASGVGMAAIQIGKAMGARVIATAGSAAKLEFAMKQGADEVIDYSDPAWVDRVKELTGGRGADMVYDPVGGDVFDLSTKCVAPEARILVIGFASGRIPAVAANRLLLKNISVVGAIWGNWVAAHPGYVAECHERFTRWVALGRIHPAVNHRYRLEDVPVALRDAANRKISGKAVIVMD